MLRVTDGDLLATHLTTRFAITGSGRLLSENDPVRAPAPRLYMAGCPDGNVVRLRHDVHDEIAQAVEALTADEPALAGPDSLPVHLEEYFRLLGSQAPADRWNAGLVWTFPERLTYQSRAALVASGTPEGDDLLRRIAECGMPQGLAALRFEGAEDFWAPWCAALYGGEIAALAFSARLSEESAETGVVTIPALRRQGYASAATSGWAALRAFSQRKLFYSTLVINGASRRVAERLGLRLLGANLGIA